MDPKVQPIHGTNLVRDMKYQLESMLSKKVKAVRVSTSRRKRARREGQGRSSMYFQLESVRCKIIEAYRFLFEIISSAKKVKVVRVRKCSPMVTYNRCGGESIFPHVAVNTITLW